ncbi:MAG: Z1 domain-containing protein, partial [Tuberibacillus sp.]
MITKVNSEKDVNQLLDETGQLKLRTPLNFFIGGQILDRAITIGNLIGFYYGRNPRSFQQDTVLQHSRMFGYRPIEDLAVTRFYTTLRIYDAMKKMQEFDSGLREAFEKGSQDNGVVFIQRDPQNQIIPCNPNKLLLSKTTTLKPFKRLLPVGFQTGYKTYISST